MEVFGDSMRNNQRRKEYESIRKNNMFIITALSIIKPMFVQTMFRWY